MNLKTSCLTTLTQSVRVLLTRQAAVKMCRYCRDLNVSQMLSNQNNLFPLTIITSMFFRSLASSFSI